MGPFRDLAQKIIETYITYLSRFFEIFPWSRDL